MTLPFPQAHRQQSIPHLRFAEAATIQNVMGLFFSLLHDAQMRWSVWAHAHEKATTSQVLPEASMARHGMAWPSPCPMPPSQQQLQEPTQCHPQHWEERAGRKRHRRASSEQLPRVNNVASLAKGELPDLKMTSGRNGKDLKNTI